MPAATDKFIKVGSPGTATTLSAPGYTAGATSITVGSTSNWPTDTGVIFAIDQAEVVNGEEVQVAGTYNEFEGVVASGTSVTGVDWKNGTGDTNYAAGPLTRVYIPVSAERENRLIDGILVHADQDGTLKAGAVDNAAVLASDVVTTAKILDSNVTTAKIADANVTPAKWANPYKFRAYRNAALNTGGVGGAKLVFDAESFDTNNNFATGTYTVPVTGYYQFNWRVKTITSGAEKFDSWLAVGGVQVSTGGTIVNTSQHVSSSGSDLIYLTATNTVEIYTANTVARALEVGATNCYFSGYLVSII